LHIYTVHKEKILLQQLHLLTQAIVEPWVVQKAITAGSIFSRASILYC